MRRATKLIVISIVMLFIVLTGISLLIPGRTRVSRAINIHAPKFRVMPMISDMRNWREWNRFVEENDSMKPRYFADSIHAGDTRIIMQSRNDELLQTVWKRGDRAYNSGLAIMEQGSVTILQWYFDFDTKWYPWERFNSILFDKQIGPVMENSLAAVEKLIGNSQ
jgi:hypothetical protein